MWERILNINEIKEIRTRSTVYFGVGAIKKINDIAKVLKDKGIDKVIVMSGRNAYKQQAPGITLKRFERPRYRLCKLRSGYAEPYNRSCKRCVLKSQEISGQKASYRNRRRVTYRRR